MFVGKNQDFLLAYSKYLETNNKTQAQSSVFASINGTTFPVDTDMFFDYLINKLVLGVITQHTFSDPLDRLYNGERLSYGASIEDKRTVLIGRDGNYRTVDFEVDVTNPFIKSKTSLSVVFHKVNRHKKIRTTYSLAQVQEAVLTEGGIAGLTNAILNDVMVQADAWSYTDKRKALTDIDYAQRIEFDDYADFTIKVKNALVDMRHFDNSWKYNSALLLSPMSINDVWIIMDEKFRNEVSVNWFTGLFNVEYAKIQEKIIFIDQFEDPSVKCLIVDRRGVYFRKTLDTARQLENGEDLTYNHFLHFWRMHSVSPHYNAVAFVVKPQTPFMAQRNTVIHANDYTFTFEGSGFYTIDGSDPTDPANANRVAFVDQDTVLLTPSVNNTLFTIKHWNGVNLDTLRASKVRFV